MKEFRIHKGSTGRIQTGTNCIQLYAIANLDKTYNSI